MFSVFSDKPAKMQLRRTPQERAESFGTELTQKRIDMSDKIDISPETAERLIWQLDLDGVSLANRRCPCGHTDMTYHADELAFLQWAVKAVPAMLARIAELEAQVPSDPKPIRLRTLRHPVDAAADPWGYSRTTVHEWQIDPNAPDPRLEVTPGRWIWPAPQMHSLRITPDMVGGTVKLTLDGLTFIPAPPEE